MITNCTVTPEFELPRTYFTDLDTGFKTLTDTGDAWNTKISTANHPGFEEFRRHLESVGLVQVRRNVINGDEVISKFILNRHQFNVGDRFLCAVAIERTLTYTSHVDPDVFNTKRNIERILGQSLECSSNIPVSYSNDDDIADVYPHVGLLVTSNDVVYYAQNDAWLPVDQEYVDWLCWVSELDVELKNQPTIDTDDMSNVVDALTERDTYDTYDAALAVVNKISNELNALNVTLLSISDSHDVKQKMLDFQNAVSQYIKTGTWNNSAGQ